MGQLLPSVLLAVAITGQTTTIAQSERPHDPDSYSDRIARFFSPKIRAADRRLAEIEERINSLPELYRGPRGSRYGFHSERIQDQETPHFLQIDMGQAWPIDSVILVPVELPIRGDEGEGYGFPKRFKIEGSADKEFADPFILVDHTEEDFENPGRYPLLFPIEGKEVRVLRLTSTKHVPSEDGGFIWAIEELIALSGNANVALGRAQASSTEELFPNWSRHRVADGFSRIGYPQSQTESPTNGFLSAPSTLANEKKWIIVDFEEPVQLDEIRLIPAESTDPEVVGGRGFPSHLVIELGDDPTFDTYHWRVASSKHPLGYPWHSAFIRTPPKDIAARYLRIQTQQLFARGDQHSFALAEIQAYADGKNLALGKPVKVSDRTSRADTSRWAPEFLVDGYSSTHGLNELPDHIAHVVERGTLEREREALRTSRRKHVETVTAGVTTGFGTLGGIAIIGWFWSLLRQRGLRRRDAIILREQIARDLHDDIGSNLGGIVLLSEVGTMHAKADPEVQNDFLEIKEAAEQTADSMRDIVWLIHVGKGTLRDLVLKMRESVERITGDIQTFVQTNPSEFRNRNLDLILRRHAFFAFKETLNNIRKHAQATSVSITIEITSSRLTFIITDNGVGFDSAGLKATGHGLENLKRRADRLHGRCTIDSNPGQGTTVTFSAPLNRKNQ